MTDQEDTSAGRPARYEARADRREEREIRAEEAQDEDRRSRRAADRFSRARLVVLSVILSCVMSFLISTLVVATTATDNSRQNCQKTKVALVQINGIMTDAEKNGREQIDKLPPNSKEYFDQMKLLERFSERAKIIQSNISDCDKDFPPTPFIE